MGGGAPDDKPEYTNVQVAQANTNTKLWNFYEENYAPIEKKYAALINDPARVKQEENQITGKIEGEAVKKINPTNLSANPVANARNLNKLNSATANAQVTGKDQVRGKNIADTQNIINIGQHKQTNAVDNLNTLAGRSLDTSLGNLDRDMQVGAVGDNAMGAMAGSAAAGLYRFGKSADKKA